MRRASELDPDNLILRDALAVVLMRMTRHADARSEMLASIERDGEQVNALCNLANATTCLGQQDEGVELARRAIDLAPNMAGPRRVLCNTLPYRDGITGAELLAALTDCSDRLPRESLPPFANTRDPNRPLVVGLLSGSFKTHPVGWLTVAGLETLDPSAFAVVCLAQNDLQDWMERRFRALAREWHDVDMMNDESLAIKARELGIDILIDLGGYGEFGAYDCLRLSSGSGAGEVGRHAEPQLRRGGNGLDHHRSLGDAARAGARLFRTAVASAGRLCVLQSAALCAGCCAAATIANGYITFGCFNNLAKVTPRVIATWCTILSRVPGRGWC